ncbi:hypothetical protein BKH43_06795 [Helicobacter sp. 13S00401-1]|uniref:DMT family transporter n=1 Tax=Helicobacter sp. 13S00401-1 TaxID=1905758 RepID=UPI000BA7D4AC|nr:DMT family transporter [Helicobacter sp. 13S00401-1]PAF49352.1 hypothetical protein BKH43_06795 [Helicobacter sp. 13S00401-1]
MSDTLKGVLLMALATIFFAIMNGLIKILGQLNMSSMESIFFRAITMVIIVFIGIVLTNIHKDIFLMFTSLRDALRSKKKGGLSKLLIRSLFGAISMSLGFYNYITIPLGIAVAFLLSTPLYITLFALFTKNKPRPIVIFATILGFLGILLISDPFHGNIPLLNIILGVLGALSGAFAFFTLKSMDGYFKSESIVLWYGIIMSLVGLFGVFILPLFGVHDDLISGLMMPHSTMWLIIIFVGISGTLAQWLMTKSYMFTSPAIVSPITYLRIIWSMIIGIFLGDKLPNLYQSLGLALIIICGVLIALPVLIQDLSDKKNFKKLKK